MRSKVKIGAVALVTGSLVGATALAATSPTGPDTRTLTAPASDPQSSGVNTTARADMPPGFPGAGEISSFRRGHQATDAVPDRLVDGPLLSDGVGDPTRARRAQVTPTRSAWIMPGRKESICLVSDAALNCAPASVVEGEGVAPSIFKTGDGPFAVMGIAADAVERVEVVLASGETRLVEVVGNAFLAESAVQPRALHWLYDGQRRSFEFPSGLAALPGG